MVDPYPSGATALLRDAAVPLTRPLLHKLVLQLQSAAALPETDVQPMSLTCKLKRFPERENAAASRRHNKRLK